MKKKLLIVSVMSFLAVLQAVANPVTLLQATRKAEKFTGSPVSQQAPGLRSATGNQPYYVFSRGAGQGYVIVSGDDCLPEILGYTESGDFPLGDMPPALEGWLNYYAGIAEQAQAQNVPAKVPAVVTGRVAVAPLIKTHWSQGAPYNNICPLITSNKNRSLTGCVATAAAQVVYYYKKDNPARLLAKTPTYSYGDAPVTMSLPAGTPIKYDLMQLNYSSAYPAEMNSAVATFMYAIGTSTWLTYGASTSGQISNLVNTFSSGFNLKSTCLYKANTSSDWETMVYNELAAGRPMVYAGYSAANGGHAIVCDGYDAVNNLFHFNFGWGGQADGYYTLDDQTGINGFSSQQGMVYGVIPKKQNLSASLSASPCLYQYLNNPVKIHVANNGTLAYKGVYLFAQETPAMPTSLSSAAALNNTLSIAPGGSADLSLVVKPMKSKTYYLFLTDANLNFLDSVAVPAKLSAPDLHINTMTAGASTLKENKGGKEYNLLYNTTADVVVPVENRSSTFFEGLYRFAVTESPNGLDSSTTTYKSVTFATQGNALTNLTLQLTNLKPGYYYSIQPEKSVFALGVSGSLQFEKDSVILVRVQNPDLKLDSVNGRSLYFSGRWNRSTFASLIANYPDATRIDLTHVAGISGQPVATNPNALFYLSDEAVFSGTNTVRKDTCMELQLTRGFDFQPVGDFFAAKAVFYPAIAAGTWGTVCLPFDCQATNGYLFRELTKHTTSSLTFNPVKNLRAFTPCFFMGSSDEKPALNAFNVKVSVNGSTSADSVFTGVYNSTPLSSSARAITAGSVQYFAAPTGPAAAFTAYLQIPGATAQILPINITTDPQYQLLAQAINSARLVLSANQSLSSEAAVGSFDSIIGVSEAYFTNQTAVTEAEITAYIALLDNAKTTFLQSTGRPVDMTSKLVNPSFELKSFKGWSAENSLLPVLKLTTIYDTFTSGFDGSYLLYVMGKDSTGTTISQKISNLPNGRYRVVAKLATDLGRSVNLYANTNSSVVDASPFGSFYFNEGAVETSVKDGTLTIGVRSPGRWFKADNFRVYYMSADTTTLVPVRNPEAKPTFVAMGSRGAIQIASEVQQSVCIYSIAGVLVRKVTISSGETTLDGLRPGMYLVNRTKVIVY